MFVSSFIPNRRDLGFQVICWIYVNLCFVAWAKRSKRRFLWRFKDKCISFYNAKTPRVKLGTFWSLNVFLVKLYVNRKQWTSYLFLIHVCIRIIKWHISKAQQISLKHENLGMTSHGRFLKAPPLYSSSKQSWKALNPTPLNFSLSPLTTAIKQYRTTHHFHSVYMCGCNKLVFVKAVSSLNACGFAETVHPNIKNDFAVTRFIFPTL